MRQKMCFVFLLALKYLWNAKMSRLCCHHWAAQEKCEELVIKSSQQNWQCHQSSKMAVFSCFSMSILRGYWWVNKSKKKKSILYVQGKKAHLSTFIMRNTTATLQSAVQLQQCIFVLKPSFKEPFSHHFSLRALDGWSIESSSLSLLWLREETFVIFDGGLIGSSNLILNHSHFLFTKLREWGEKWRPKEIKIGFRHLTSFYLIIHPLSLTLVLINFG